MGVEAHSTWQVAFGSIGSSFFSVILPYPLDVVRTRQQSGVTKQRRVFLVLRELYLKHKLRSLYKGLSGVLAFDLFGTFAYFRTFTTVKSVLSKTDTSVFLLGESGYRQNAEDAVSGLCSIMCGLLFWVPMDCIVAKSQVTSFYNSPLRIAQAIVVREGVLHGFYKGYWQSLATSGPLCSVFWCMYEWLKRRRLAAIRIHNQQTSIYNCTFDDYSEIECDDCGNSHLNAANQIHCGHLLVDSCIAGVTSIFLTQWIDTLRCRTQVSGARGIECYGTQPMASTGVFSQLRVMHRTHGALSMLRTLFWTGFRARLLTTGPDLILGIVSFEALIHSVSGRYI